MKRYVIDKGCKLCDGCYWICPTRAIYIEDNRTAKIDQVKCIHCGQCYDNCANEAISACSDEQSRTRTEDRTNERSQR